jgi:hypothetical protein
MAREAVSRDGVDAETTTPARRARDHVATIEHNKSAMEILRSIAEIDMDDLRTEVQTAGGTAIYFGAMAAQATSSVRRAKLAFDVIKAQTARRIRAAARSVQEKTTENSIAEEVLLDDEVRAAEEAIIVAEERAGILRSVMTATEQKHRTLGNLSGALARELGVTGNAEGLDALVRGRVTDRNAVRGRA